MYVKTVTIGSLSQYRIVTISDFYFISEVPLLLTHWDRIRVAGKKYPDFKVTEEVATYPYTV